MASGAKRAGDMRCATSRACVRNDRRAHLRPLEPLPVAARSPGSLVASTFAGEYAPAVSREHMREANGRAPVGARPNTSHRGPKLCPGDGHRSAVTSARSPGAYPAFIASVGVGSRWIPGPIVVVNVIDLM